MNIIKNKIKAIIFDMDGTIIDSERIWERATKEFFISKGFDFKSFNYQKFVGISADKSALIIKEEFKLKDSVKQILQQKTKIVHRLFEKEIKLIEGFADFHKKLKDHEFATSIATNADIKTISIINKSTKLSNFFGSHLYSMEHVGNRSKPDPAVFLYAAEKLNAKPEECLVFEDSKAGFQAAKSAGIKCIAIKNERNKDFLSLTDFAIENYHQAEEAIRKIVF